MIYILYWADPADPDLTSCKGFELFGSKQGMLDAMNALLVYRPAVKPLAFEATCQLEVRKVTRFTFD